MTTTVMSPRWRAALLLLAAGAIIVVQGLHIVDPQPGHDGDYWPWPLGTMAYPVVAAVILARRPGNAIGRTLGVVSIAVGTIFFTHWLAVRDMGAAVSQPAEALSSVAAYLQFGGMVALLYLFPTGRTLGGWYRRAFVAWCVFVGASAVLEVVRPGPMAVTGRDNPWGVLPEAVGDVLAGVAILMVPFALVGVVSLGVRWRREVGVERVQLRWFAFAALVMVVTLVVLGLVDAAGDPELASAWLDVLLGVAIAAGLYWSLPAAIGVAVLRYRLYDIDRIISRTVTWTILAVLVVAVFALGVVGVQAMLPASSDLAVAGSTLVVAALFNPVRRRVQHRVDRQFNRSRYHAEQLLGAFAARLRHSTDLEVLARDVLEVVDEALRPASATMWVADRPADLAAPTRR